MQIAPCALIIALFRIPQACAGTRSERTVRTMAKEYIEREAARIAYDRSYKANTHNLYVAKAVHAQEHRHILHILDKIPTADVVSRVAYDQCAWERDLAIHQLRNDYGVGLGEQKSVDVVEVVRCGKCIHRVYVDMGDDIGAIGGCRLFGHAMSINDFCSYGERRDSNE